MKNKIVISFSFLMMLLLSSFKVQASEVYEIHVMDFYPSHFKDQDGRVVGREVERIEEAFKAVGKSVKFILVPIHRCIFMLHQGTAKMCGTLAVSKNTRHENVEIHKVALSPNKSRAFFAKSKNDKKEYDLNDLKNVNVGVYNIPEYIDDLKRRGAMVDATLNDLFVVKKIISRRINLGIIHESTFNYLPKEERNRLKRIGDFIELEGFVGFSSSFESRKKVMDELDHGLKIIQKNGKMDQINKKWKALIEQSAKKN